MDYAVTALTLPLTALTTGFLGSVHCLGMCGGISGTIALGATRPARAGNPGTSFPDSIPIVVARGSAPVLSSRQTHSLSTPQTNVLAFNAGRVASYMVAGALAGTVGGVIGQGWVISETLNARMFLFLFANLLIVATGLYLMGLPQILAPLERAGGHLWRRIAPYTKKLLPMNTAPRAALFGMLWGWIPCGMVYAMLLSAMGAGSAAGGMATMLAFGIGTLPAMIVVGWAAGSVQRWTRDSRVRLAAGAAVVAMGLSGFARADGLQQLQAFGAFCMTAIESTAAVTP